MRSSGFALACAALAALTFAGLARADALFMNIGFDGDTVGSSPSTSTSTALPITKPYAIGGYGPTTTDLYGDNPLIASDGTALVSNVGTLSKAAVLTNAAGNGEVGAVYLDTAYNVTANQFRISFDVDVLSTVASSEAFTFSLNGTQQQVGVILGVNQFTAAGASLFAFAAAPTSSSGGVFGFRNANGTDLNSFFDYQVGTTYHIDVLADYLTQSVSAYVDGNLEMSGFGMRAGKSSNVQQETFVFISGDPDGTNSVAIDNLQGAVPVPLPASATGAVVLLGGLFATRRLTKRAAQA